MLFAICMDYGKNNFESYNSFILKIKNDIRTPSSDSVFVNKEKFYRPVHKN